MRPFIRLTIIFALLLIFPVAIAAAQSGPIRFSASSLTAGEALEQIRQQTGHGVAFNGRVFDASRTVELTSPAPTLEAALRQILEGTGFSYTIDKGIISLSRTAAAAAPRPAPVVTERHPRTNDTYVRSDFSDFDTDPLPNPVAEQPRPVLEPVETTDTIQILEQPQPQQLTSHYEPITSFAATQTALPRWAVKTNLLYGAATLTPNLAIEVGLGRRTSLQLSGSYNPWNLKGTVDKDKKMVHMILGPEFRYWFCERYNGHFLGADLIFGKYNISTHEVPLLFEKEYRYQGVVYGAGITYGYQMMLGKRWGLEFAIGAGVLLLDYDRYSCAACDRNAVPKKKTYFGPTNAAINLIFLIK